MSQGHAHTKIPAQTGRKGLRLLELAFAQVLKIYHGDAWLASGNWSPLLLRSSG